MTPEVASGSQRRRDPVLPKTAAATMPELSVAILAPDKKQRTALKALVDSTGVARTVLTCDISRWLRPIP